MLYNGAVQRIIRGAFTREFADIPKSMRAYHIERQDTCPAVKLPDDEDQWPDDRFDIADRPRDRVQGRVAAGECIIGEPATLSDADFVLTERSERQPAPRPLSSPNFFPDTVAARRIEFSAFENGRLKIFHRKTQVESRPIAYPFMVANDLSSNHMEAGFLRHRVTDNRYTFASETKALFGDGVKVPNGIEDSGDVVRLLAALRDKALPAGDPRLQLGDQVLKRIAFRGASGPDDILAVRLLVEDRRFTDHFHLAGAVSKLGPDAADLAGPLLDRLMEAPLPAGRDIVQTMSRAIGNLPTAALVPAMDRLEQLAAIEVRRGTAMIALSRLADAGAVAAPRLVALLETRRQEKSLPMYSDERSTVIGALLGLCRLGPQARDAVEAWLRCYARKRVAAASARGGILQSSCLAAPDLPTWRCNSCRTTRTC